MLLLICLISAVSFINGGVFYLRLWFFEHFFLLLAGFQDYLFGLLCFVAVDLYFNAVRGPVACAVVVDCVRGQNIVQDYLFVVPCVELGGSEVDLLDPAFSLSNLYVVAFEERVVGVDENPGHYMKKRDN